MAEKIHHQAIYLSPDIVSNYKENKDEVDLRELFSNLWCGRWVIILLTIVFTVSATIYAIYQPNYYKAEVLLAPSSGDSSPNSLAGLGGLAALAGVNLGNTGTTDNTKLALAVLSSRDFQVNFINKNDVKPSLFAGVTWNKENDMLVIDDEIYDQKSRSWLRDGVAGKEFEPSNWDAYKAFSSIINATQDKDNGLVTISIEFLSPTIAKQWLEILVRDLNVVMKQRELSETQRNIDYLENKILSTPIAEMQAVFYQLIEEQIKNKMIAEVQEEFVFKIIDPAVVPEDKSKPNRLIICVLGALLGFIIGVSVILIRFVFSRNDP